MKVTTSLAIASLATSALAAGAAHKGRHARFHEAKREAEILEMHKRAIDADPSLAKRCGEMINAMYDGNTPMSFPNCFGPCAGAAECGSGAAPAAAASTPAAAAPVAAAPVAETPAAAATTPAANVVNNKQQAAAPATSAAAKTSAAAASTPAASTSSSSSSSSSGGKIGLAYNDPSLLTGEWLSGDASWAYNWDYRAGNLNSKLQFVPMFHDPGALAGFTAANFASGTPLLSLNEPDQPVSAGGCLLSPADACTSHKAAFKNKSGYQVGAPAVSSQDAPNMGLKWLTSFQSACSDAQVDFVPLHWYGGGGSGADQGKAFLQYIDTAVATVGKLYPGKKIWFTEYAATPVTDAQVNADFLNAVLPSMKSNPNIDRIAPFMVGSGGALGTSTPNAAGKVLIAA